MNWISQLCGPEQETQAGVGGVSVEDLVQLCNTAHVNLWIGTPVNADAGYETNFAQYVEPES